MRNFLQRFMSGRYGLDNLSKFLLILWFGLAAVNIIFRETAIYIVSLVPAVLFFFRFFSTNTTRRIAENTKYLAVVNKSGSWFKLQWQKLREIRTHRYIKCPECRAVLRVPRKTGKHTLVCPRCSKRFETDIKL